jgi:hypothetical protein
MALGTLYLADTPFIKMPEPPPLVPFHILAHVARRRTHQIAYVLPLRLPQVIHL